MAGNIKSAKDYPTIVKITELEKDKFMLNIVINKQQLRTIFNIFEPLSREWRGQYQALAKAIVEAFQDLEEGE